MPSAEGRPKDEGNVALAYRGFDGEPWPLATDQMSFRIDSGLVALSHLAEVRRYYELASIESNDDLIDIIYVQDPDSPSPFGESWVFLGYDYGYYESEMELYSAIYHEILHGSYDELRAQAFVLNANALFATAGEARLLDPLRTKLLDSGADLETDGNEFRAIGIYDPRQR